jgi:hypothetical protein
VSVDAGGTAAAHGATNRWAPGDGREVDPDAIRAWWSLRSLTANRWLVEHRFDPSAPGCEVDVLRAQM